MSIIVSDCEVSKLKPYEFNIKKHPQSQIDRLKESIEKFGWVQPIVVDENYEIIIGHGRFEAAIQLKLSIVPVVIKTDYTEDEKRTLRIIDNKLSADAPLDLVNAEKELLWLKQNSEASMEMFKSFGLAEIPLPVFTPPPPEPTKSKINDSQIEEPKKTLITISIDPDCKDDFLLNLNSLCENYNDVVIKVK